MNILPISKRVQIINLLVEGMSLRATSRVADVSINTVVKLLIDAGKACQSFHDDTVYGLTSQRIQCDEIWSFVYSKEKNVPEELKGSGIGDAWTWVGIDSDSKLVVSWLVGPRDAISAYTLMSDIKSRLKHRVQLTTDGFLVYMEAVSEAFGSKVDFARLVKRYGGYEETEGKERRYSPSKYIGADKIIVQGNPDKKFVSTSHIERQNLTMRMHMRRFTRLTNAFSKKLENHSHAVALHFVYYNFVKIHTTLRVTPAMEAGLTKDLMTIEDIVKLI
jgi:IS1 family transposase